MNSLNSEPWPASNQMHWCSQKGRWTRSWATASSKPSKRPVTTRTWKCGGKRARLRAGICIQGRLPECSSATIACMNPRRRILLAQLPIPPLGPAPIRGNIPLAAAYLKLLAERRGLAASYHIELFPAGLANSLGDQALVTAIAQREPWLVGFTCYLWNIERTLWVARELKRLLPGVRIVLGGPEITADNAWVLDTPDYDFAVIGEGEQTFADLLLGLLGDDVPPVPIPGLFVPSTERHSRGDPVHPPAFRT